MIPGEDLLAGGRMAEADAAWAMVDACTKYAASDAANMARTSAFRFGRVQEGRRCEARETTP